ncbi:MAG: hypothetical protein JNL74_22990, partial [Fibrobacteres bacterium]|nr:hypothetical protein [Fibrobacterota bacterium]
KQGRNIKEALANSQWETAEQQLDLLSRDQTFLDQAAAAGKKRTLVLSLEDALYNAIDKVSREKIFKFLEEKVKEVENVDSLYADSVFLPVYNVTFSSGSQQHLLGKNEELKAMLLAVKNNEFPAKAITLMYEEFLKNPDDNGVLKARAVVTHGKYYQGDDNKIKLRIAECDPEIPKRITKPLDYRRVFALPATDNRTGTNKYFCRLDLALPSDAAFPVWDITVKLPPAVAKKAATEQWFDKITLNKNPLKNEGRFSISSPTAENGYECQISPVQTTKDGKNILDIYFNHKSFKAYPISVMLQKPIIKKN